MLLGRTSTGVPNMHMPKTDCTHHLPCQRNSGFHAKYSATVKLHSMAN